MTARRFITCTGQAAEHLPPDGQERDELLGLIRLGLRFREQHQGRHPGFLRRYIADLIGRHHSRMSFDALLLELRLQARRRELLGPSESPVEKVDMEWELVTYHHPKLGRKPATFKTLKNLLSILKKENPDMPYSGNSD